MSWGVSGALALWPLFELASFVLGTGADVHSNDYLLWVPLVSKMMSPEYSWLGYFQDSFQGGCHSFAIPVLATLAIAQLTDWSMRATLVVALILSTVKLAFLQSALTHGSSRWIRLISFPLLSFLLFSPANVDVFSFGFTATHVAFAELGFVVAVWGVVRLRRRELAASVGIIGAVVATLSWGSGLMVWPVLCCALWASGDRQKKVATAVLLWGGLAAMPYAFLTNMAETAPTRWDPWLPVEMLGWSWSANFNHLRARAVGASGLIVLAVVVISVWQRRARLAQFVPALAFVGYSIGLMTLVGAFRGQLAAWYSSTVGFFWVGVLGVLIQIAPELSPRTTWRWGFPVFASFVLLWMTNGDFSEKARYLLSRGFTASSCLRNFRTAPAVCEGTLFQWKRGNPQNLWVLGEPLEKRGWGVFGPEQTWSLQGDFAFDNVEFRGAEPSWVTPEGVVASPLTSFQKLNLELSRSSRIDWQLALPGGLREARLRTVVSNAGRLRVWLSSVSGRELLLARTSLAGTTTEVDVSFVRWAGQVVTLSLELDANEAATLVAQFPRIEVSLNADARSPQVSYAVPIVGERGRDLVFDASLQSWQLTALKPLGGGRFGAMGWAPTMTLKERLNVCAADYSRLVVRGSPSPDMRFRELHVMTRDPEGPEPTKNSMYLSMFSGSSRDYAFRLRLLGLPPDAVLPTLALRPPPGDYFEVSEVRLERRDGQTRCRARR